MLAVNRLVGAIVRNSHSTIRFASIMPKFKLAICQLKVGADKTQNLQNAREHIEQAASTGAKVIVLPVCC